MYGYVDSNAALDVCHVQTPALTFILEYLEYRRRERSRFVDRIGRSAVANRLICWLFYPHWLPCYATPRINHLSAHTLQARDVERAWGRFLVITHMHCFHWRHSHLASLPIQIDRIRRNSISPVCWTNTDGIRWHRTIRAQIANLSVGLLAVRGMRLCNGTCSKRLRAFCHLGNSYLKGKLRHEWWVRQRQNINSNGRRSY